jgi:hypothetical protein
MSDPAPEFQPDHLSATKLVMVSMGRMLDALQSLADSSPLASAMLMHIKLARQSLDTAGAQLDDPNAEPAEPPPPAVEPPPPEPAPPVDLPPPTPPAEPAPLDG